jgi:hypothetical protein
LAADFLLPAFVRPVFFWPALAAGVLAILNPRSALPGRHCATALFQTWRYSRLGAIPDLALFQILHLLAKLLDHRLELKPDIGERHVV